MIFFRLKDRCPGCSTIKHTFSISRVDILQKMEVNYIRSFFSIFLLGTHRGALLLNILTVKCLHQWVITICNKTSDIVHFQPRPFLGLYPPDYIYGYLVKKVNSDFFKIQSDYEIIQQNVSVFQLPYLTYHVILLAMHSYLIQQLTISFYPERALLPQNMQFITEYRQLE